MNIQSRGIPTSTTVATTNLLVALLVEMTPDIKSARHEIEEFTSLEKQNHKNSEKKTFNIFSQLFFLKSLKLFKRGRSNDIEAKYIYKLWPYCKSQKLGDNLEAKWDELKRKHQKVSIPRVLWKCFGTTFLLYGFLQAFVEIASILAQPYLIGKVVSYFTPGQTEFTKNEALVHAIVLIAVLFLNDFYTNNYGLLMAGFGIRIRTALCSFLYRKILKLGSARLDDLSGGKILTLITKDIQSLEMFAVVGNELWICILKVISLCCILYAKIGTSILVGILCFLLITPLQIYFGMKVKTMKLKMCKQSDERLQIIQESMSGIRLIKMYTWEKFFGDKIHNSRKKEMSAALKMFIIKFTIFTVGNLNSDIAMYITLMTYIYLGNNISGEIYYFTLKIFSSLVLLFGRTFPDVLYKAFEALSATKRLEDAVEKIEILKGESKMERTTSPQIIFENVAVTIQDRNVLTKVNAILSKGLMVVSGPVGSGKSIFLKTILDDYTPNQGTVTVQGSISYSSQEPWLFPASIRTNILFGQEYDPKRYQEVLRICALSYDLELLKNGDATIVENQGANLSKGQQARINLARAVYKDSDIYLLDDPLAGLDANVAAYVFEECVKKLLQDKLVVLVTHNPNYRDEAKEVLYFENGNVRTSETGDWVQAEKSEDDDEKIVEEGDKNVSEDVDESTKLIDIKEKAIYQEKKKLGNIEMKTYKDYIRFGGGLFAIFVVFCFHAGTAALIHYRNIFIGDWVDAEESILFSSNATNNSFGIDLQLQHGRIFWIYSLLTAIFIVACIVRSASILIFSRAASIRIHKTMISKIIHAPTHFFDKHFLGNILNRFSKDLTVVDEVIQFLISGAFMSVSLIIGAITVIAIVNKLFIVPMAILFSIMFLCRQYTIRTTTNLKRLDATTRSPIVGHLNATLEGLTTIRAFRAQDIFKKDFDQHQDLNASTSYAFESSSNAYNFILNNLANIFKTVIIMKFFLTDNDITAGYIGLTISYAILISGSINQAISAWAALDNHMSSTERVLEYTQIKEENSHGLELQGWPKLGKITFEAVHLLYPNSTKHIFNNLNLTIEPGEKIGIVGRTGAGKSSLISVLFRMYDIEGKVTVDDVDIRTISLQFLRSKISIIPQEPILFSGSIRDNIDPFRKCSDEEIWTAIDKVNLKKIVTSLDAVVGANSLNFSLGEKQLLCIARAIVQKNKIVVLDEATASTDLDTEKLIYRSIEENFSGCTVLTIAHKLQTVLNSDRVLVLEKGDIVECEKPSVLLENKESIFYKMVARARLLKEGIKKSE